MSTKEYNAMTHHHGRDKGEASIFEPTNSNSKDRRKRCREGNDPKGGEHEWKPRGTRCGENGNEKTLFCRVIVDKRPTWFTETLLETENMKPQAIDLVPMNVIAVTPSHTIVSLECDICDVPFSLF